MSSHFYWATPFLSLSLQIFFISFMYNNICNIIFQNNLDYLGGTIFVRILQCDITSSVPYCPHFWVWKKALYADHINEDELMFLSLRE